MRDMSNFVIGAELRLDGEKDFKRAVSSVNQDLKVLSSELKKTESEYKGNADSISGLTAKSEQFAKIAEAQRKKVEILHQAVEKSRARFTAAGENVEKYRKELADAQSELERMKSSSGATTEEIAEQEKTVAELSGKLEKAEKAYDAAEKSTKRWEISLNNAEAELNDTERELEQTEKAMRDMGDATKYSKEQLEQAEDTLSDYGQKAEPIVNAGKTAFKALAAVTAAAVGASAAVIKKSVDIGGEFESQMSKVQAISGATGDDLAALRDKAKEMGSTTKFTATQAGQALEYMAMAGWDSQKMLDGLEGVMNLAAAAGEDLGTTSDIVTDALTAFKLEAKDSTHFADLLAQASSKSNTNVAMLGETFKYAAPICGTMGYKAEDAAIAIGLMANAGIKGSTAGTALRSAITNMSAPTKQMKIAMDDLGISITNNDGTMKSLDEVLGILRTSFAGLTKDQQAAYAKAIFGKQAMSGMLAVINASTQDYNALKTAMYDCDGAAKQMADTMQDNLNGQITILKSGLEGAAISIYDEMQKPMTEGVKTIISTLNDPRIQSGIKTIGKQFGDMFSGVAQFAAKHAPEFIKGFQKMTNYLSGSSFKSTVKSGVELFGNVGKVALTIGKVALPVATTGLELLAKSGKVLVPVLAAAYAGFKAFQIVKTVTTLIEGAGAAFQALNVIMMANPWALVAGAIAAVTIALIGLNASNSEAEEKYADLREEIDETAESMKQMAKSRQESYDSQYQEIFQVEKLRDRLDELVDKNGKLKGSKEELQSVVKQLNEKGFEVELNKTGTLIKNYKDLKKEIDEYIERKHITAKLEALEPEYNQHSVNLEKYQKDALEKKAEYEKAQADFEKKFGIKYGSKEFIDLYENSSMKTQGKEWKEAVKLIEAYGDAWSQAFRKEDEAIKMINAVDEANRLFAAGKYDEANKVLSDYFEERANLFKKASDYEKEQRAQAIDDLGNQLLDEMDMYKAATISGSQDMVDLTLSYVQKAADELKKIGIEIPDGIIEGLKNGTLSVDDAMQQIQEIIKNGGQVDLTEEGVEISDTLSDGLKLGIDTVAGAGAELVDSAVKPMGAPTPKAEAKKYGQEMGDAYVDGVDDKAGAAENAGEGLSDSTVKGLGSSEGAAENEGRKMGTQFSGGIDGQQGKIKQAGKDAGNTAIKAFDSTKASASESGKSLGSALGAGIPLGISSKIESIKTSAKNAVLRAMEAARKAADVNSPSKKTRDLVGKPLAEGVAVGFEKGAPDAARRAAASTSAIISRMQAATSAATAKINGADRFTGTSGGNVSKTINISYSNQFTGASARDGEALIRQLDRALGANL